MPAPPAWPSARTLDWRWQAGGGDRSALPGDRRAALSVDRRAHHRSTPAPASIVPGGAEMLFQFRDADPAVLERLQAALVELVAEADAGPAT